MSTPGRSRASESLESPGHHCGTDVPTVPADWGTLAPCHLSLGRRSLGSLCKDPHRVTPAKYIEMPHPINLRQLLDVIKGHAAAGVGKAPRETHKRHDTPSLPISHLVQGSNCQKAMCDPCKGFPNKRDGRRKASAAARTSSKAKVRRRKGRTGPAQIAHRPNSLSVDRTTCTHPSIERSPRAG